MISDAAIPQNPGREESEKGNGTRGQQTRSQVFRRQANRREHENGEAGQEVPKAVAEMVIEVAPVVEQRVLNPKVEGILKPGVVVRCQEESA